MHIADKLENKSIEKLKAKKGSWEGHTCLPLSPHLVDNERDQLSKRHSRTTTKTTAFCVVKS